MTIEWQHNYESVDINTEMQKSLSDNMLTPDEAKTLSDILRANQERVFQVTKQNLDDLRKTLKIDSNASFITQVDEDALSKVSFDYWNPIEINNTPIVAENLVDGSVSRSDDYNKVKNEKVYNISQTLENIFNMGWDWVLWWDKSEYINWQTEELAKLEFRAKYWEFTSKLSSSLWLPKWMINAIVHEETDFWMWRIDKKTGDRILNSKSWSKGIMQLTKSPFKDIKWDTSSRKVVDYDKIERYRDVFKRINFDELKTINMWDWKTIESTLSVDIWQKLQKLKDPNVSSVEARDILWDFQDIIKSKENKHVYFHTLNMIIWSVYLANIYDNVSWSDEYRIKKSAERYNWESWNRKVRYANRVYDYYLEEQAQNFNA